MSLLREFKKICKDLNINPKKKLGQNFLIDSFVYDSVIDAASINKDDNVLEVGPGLGILTEYLAERAKNVLAVELDKEIFLYLKEKFIDNQNIHILNENILDFSFDYFRSQDYKIVANLPYHITSCFLRKFLSNENSPVSMTLMLQKEVAQRIVASDKKESKLSISVKFYADAKIIRYVDRDSFWPVPKVDSAIIHIKKLKNSLLLDKEDIKKFFRLVKFGFINKRKMLKNNLAAAFRKDTGYIENILIKNNLNPKIRAQDLYIDNWLLFLKIFREELE